MPTMSTAGDHEQLDAQWLLVPMLDEASHLACTVLGVRLNAAIVFRLAFNGFTMITW